MDENSATATNNYFTKVLQCIVSDLHLYRERDICVNTTEEDKEKVIDKVILFVEIFERILKRDNSNMFYQMFGIYAKNPQVMQRDLAKYNHQLNGEKNWLTCSDDFVFASPALVRVICWNFFFC